MLYVCTGIVWVSGEEYCWIGILSISINIVTTSVFDALSIGSGPVAAVLL